MKNNKKKRLHSYKFHDKDFNVWQNIAEKKGVPITTLIEKAMNKLAEEPHLFI
jgi:hypothetical protein